MLRTVDCCTFRLSELVVLTVIGARKTGTAQSKVGSTVHKSQKTWLVKEQEAQLSPRDRAMRRVS